MRYGRGAAWCAPQRLSRCAERAEASDVVAQEIRLETMRKECIGIHPRIILARFPCAIRSQCGSTQPRSSTQDSGMGGRVSCESPPPPHACPRLSSKGAKQGPAHTRTRLCRDCSVSVHSCAAASDAVPGQNHSRQWMNRLTSPVVMTVLNRTAPAARTP